jgi:hypothetical protein
LRLFSYRVHKLLGQIWDVLWKGMAGRVPLPLLPRRCQQVSEGEPVSLSLRTRYLVIAPCEVCFFVGHLCGCLV